MPDTLTSSTSESSRETIPLVFALRHLSGERRGNEQFYESGRVTIGRGRNNECCFDSERERSVSHRHCEIRTEEGLVVLYDVGSLNGTYLNGRRVRRAPLADGDEIGLGREGPRLRFGTKSRQRSLRAPRPESPETQLGKTSRESPLTAPQPEPPLTVSRWVPPLVGLVLIGLAALTFQLLNRISALEGSSQTSEAGASKPDAAESPASKPKTAALPVPRSSTITLFGVLEDSAGNYSFPKEFGAGVAVANNLLVTTLDVLKSLRTFSRSSPAAPGTLRIVAAPAGDLNQAMKISGWFPRAGSEINDAEGLLLLTTDPGSQLTPTRIKPIKGFESKWFPAGERPRSVEILRYLTRSQTPTSESSQATFFRFRPATTPPGTPLFQGEDLIGVAFGPSLSGTALTARGLKGLIISAQEHPEHVRAF